MTSHALRALATLSIAALVLAGCSDDSNGTAGDGKISIVASTNVYGDIARAVAGDHAEITSILSSSTQDPHEYEASAHDRLAVDGASIVIENGGGYDPFIDKMVDDSDSKAAVLTAVDVSGLLPKEGEQGEEGFNEHVWYDLHAVDKVAEELGRELSTIDPDNSSTYAANYQDFAKKLKDLERTAADLKTTADGQGVAITEPVPLYLLSAVGLVNHTPDEFSEAVEEGGDVAPRVLQETLDVVTGGNVALLAYNTQTADSTTEQVRAAAEGAGVPIVDFTENLPDGQSYLEWQESNLDHIATALG